MDDISSLIDVVVKLYKDPKFHTKNYSFNVKGIYDAIGALEEFNSLIGMKSAKKEMLRFIKCYSQPLFINSNRRDIKYDKKLNYHGQTQLKVDTSTIYNKNGKCLSEQNNSPMLHSVIYGPPGTGKTTLGKTIARVCLNLNLCNKNTFKVVKRHDLVGGYTGQTAILTQNIINESLGGVLYLDDTYLGDDKINGFGKEAIDTINVALSEHKNNLICIVSGYEKQLQKYFFDVNPGLKRRFPFIYKINNYTWEELTEILLFKIKNDIKWSISDNVSKWLVKKQYLRDKMDKFPFFGGDIETFWNKIKLYHSSRVFGSDFKLFTHITKEDIQNGYDNFISMNKCNNRPETLTYFI
jgi:stage V sporulation protein K